MKKKGIVKVQVSLFTSDGIPQALVYNKKRDLMWEGPVSKEIEFEMGGEDKKFFHATWNSKGGEFIVLLKEAPYQDW